MTTPPPEAPTGPEPAGDPGPPGPQEGPRATSSDIKDLARLRRTTGPNKKVAGVAGGLARHLDIDPLVLRVVLVVLVFFGGAGIIVYGACWLLVPEDGDDRAPFNFDDRTRSVALVVAGVIATLALLGDTMGGYGFPWPLAILALVVLVVVSLSDRGNGSQPTVPPAPTGSAVPPSTPAWTTTSTMPATQQGWVEPQTTWQAQAYTTQQPSSAHAQAPLLYRNPRKRGPILFWWTLALAALGIGILGMADAAGAGVADSSYPALVVAICGAMLLVGAFFGRAGGLILVGLLAAVGMAGATADSRWDDRTFYTPATAATVEDTYDMGAGEQVLDLTEVGDLENLDGRTITVQAGLGSIEVILPEGLDVEAEVHVGLGGSEVFGEANEGSGIDLTRNYDGGVGAPELHLDIEVGLGEVDVRVLETTGADR